MSNEDISKAIKSIIEKEFKGISKLIPSDVLSNIEKNISPQIEDIIEQSGFVKRSKYRNLKKIIDDLEKRLLELEKTRAD